MSRGGLSNLHIAGLHERAAELDVPGYRMLGREELIAAIQAAGGDARSADEEAAPRAEPASTPARRRRRPARARLDEEPQESEEPEEAPEETEPVSGVLDLTGQGHGFLRLDGLERGDDDVYISASQIRRCELRIGDQVSGPARPPRRGERHRALVHVDTVNGAEPVADGRPDLESLTPVTPTRRLPLETDDVLVRAADLLAPLAFGQRVLVAAAPRSGRTTLLRGLATALAGVEGVELVVLLIDERPEEATAWREALPGAELAIATADMSPTDQLRVADLALERARRRAEAGADSVLICDSLSRLAVAARDAAPVKRLFGSGRQLDGDGAGSLTVIATTLADDDASDAVATTENALVTLSAELAAAGVSPALDAMRTRASDEDKLLSEDELADLRALRAELDGLEPAEAAAKLRDRLEAN